ncbi:MAG TPA: efflux RND transporter periplasmic adaptor subunit [Hyphomicrobium sp.]|nr:efflux RND transporter periplasmic adaptor subunit [Hyphomicrobium sp.]
MTTSSNQPRPRSKAHLLASAFVLTLTAGAGAVGAITLGVPDVSFTGSAKAEPAKAATSELAWIAAAPGRVEPKSGQVRVGAGLLGRIAEVTVGLNDEVEEGELLIRLDDEEARARLQAAETEAASRKRERDAQPLDKARDELRKAEDAVFAAERQVTNAQFELEYELQAKRSGSGSSDRVSQARAQLKDARARLQKERSSYATAQAKPDVPAPSRLESALQAARSEVAVAEALLEKTRIRAPVSGAILQLPAKAGEMVAPSPDQVLAVIGDMSVVRVKAELDEYDVSKVKVGSKAIVKSNAYPGREFNGTVAQMSPTLAAPKVSLRGARRPTDVEVREVTIDLDGDVPLIPGMRADAFFKKAE